MAKLAPDAVRVELARVLVTPMFARCQRLSALLSHLVEHALEGRAESLKEPVLGAELFGRMSNWDPRKDATVRMYVTRLREKLRQYYDSEGRRDPVIIEIPKRSYVPRWRSGRYRLSSQIPRRTIVK